MEQLKLMALTAAGKAEEDGAMEMLQSRIEEFGDMEDTHAEERFIATQKHTKSARPLQYSAVASSGFGWPSLPVAWCSITPG